MSRFQTLCYANRIMDLKDYSLFIEFTRILWNSHTIAHNYLAAEPSCAIGLWYAAGTSHFLAHTALGPYCTGPYVTSCKTWDVKNTNSKCEKPSMISQILHSKSQ